MYNKKQNIMNKNKKIILSEYIKIKYLLMFIIIINVFINSKAQIKDNILGQKFYNKALKYSEKYNFDSAEISFKKVIEIYKITGNIKKQIESSCKLANIYSRQSEYAKSINLLKKTQKLCNEKIDKENIQTVNIFTNMAFAYFIKGKYYTSIKKYKKAIKILNNLKVTTKLDYVKVYNGMGDAYKMRGEYTLSLEYYKKAYRLKKFIYEENSPEFCNSYDRIGSIYNVTGDPDFALYYFDMSLNIKLSYYTDDHPDLAISYYNIANAYNEKQQYRMAMNYWLKVLKIRRKFFKKTSSEFAQTYKGIGDSFIGLNENKRAQKYYAKSLKINEKIFKLKHPSVAELLYCLGNTYKNENNLAKALLFYQKSIAANLKYFNDSLNVYKKPVLVSYYNQNILLASLQAKADVLEQRYVLTKNNQDLKIALQTVQLCDNLINKIRRSYKKIDDKIAIGKKATSIYERAVSVCYKIYNITKRDKYLFQSFYASEKNKGGSLLGALAEIEAQKFASIPDSVQAISKGYKIKISEFEKQIAVLPYEQENDTLSDKLFQTNRAYDKLISSLEKKYSKYYKFKYSYHTTSTLKIKTILNKNNALRSYFIGENKIFIFTITKDTMYIETVEKIKSLNNDIKQLRAMIISGHSKKGVKTYQKLAYKIYKQLFPKPLNENIKNIIIVPDGVLGIIPFETLFTEEYKGKINKFENYPYLIKKYGISYTYSSNLFYHTFEEKSNVKVNYIKEWLALAPVFTSKTTNKVSNGARGISHKSSQSFDTRAFLNSTHITPLPASENEVNSIHKKFNKKRLKADVKCHAKTNEKFVKSGILKDYRYLHFATHGFVNSKKPELSGILLAQDTLGGNDGILFSGEIYNLELNSDLVVLSACETGLGKISKGEGVIGLTRALLYAGTKNIIVSLWQVADKSTSDLMIDFYENLLTNEKNRKNFTKPFRTSKLDMIKKGGKFAHPYFWSPFILIGK